jgi:hypothetical protein
VVNVRQPIGKTRQELLFHQSVVRTSEPERIKGRQHRTMVQDLGKKK